MVTSFGSVPGFSSTEECDRFFVSEQQHNVTFNYDRGNQKHQGRIEKARGESKRESRGNRNGNRESNKRESKRSGENLAGIYGNLGVPGENLAGIYGNLEKVRGESQPVIEDGQGRISAGNRGWSGENLFFWSELITPYRGVYDRVSQKIEWLRFILTL